MSKGNYQELTDQEISSALRSYDMLPTRSELESVRRYISLLLAWNQKISLTGLSDPAEIVTRHFGESWYLTKILDLESGRLADIGSGAGFPGLALKLIRPGLEITLVEQNKKKSAFLSEMIRTLSLAGVSVVASAYEDWSVSPASLDFLTARALGQYPRLLNWAGQVLKASGYVALWLGDEESNHLQSKSGWSWKLPERIPGSLRRQILVGSPVVPNVDSFLRGSHP